jgi:hypothetical protein
MPEERRPGTGPILSPGGAPAATASRPDDRFEDGRWHRYEAHRVPWWITLLWGAFFVFGAGYLIVNLLE